jgi:hypothetical protein
MRSSCLALLAVAALASGGCFQMTTIVRVNGDGSGTVDHTMLVSKAALAQLRQFAALAGGGRGQAQHLDFISEEQARAMAETLGPGVAYVSSSPIDTPLGEGRQATYSFADITALRISSQPKTDGLPVPSSVASASGDITCTFTREPNGNSVLRILLPEATIPDALANASASAGPGFSQQLALVRTMLAGARILIAVEPAGQLVRTNSPYAEGARVSLLDVNLDQLLGNEAFMTRLQEARTADEVKAALRDVPGLKLTLDREVTIEFTPAK